MHYSFVVVGVSPGLWELWYSQICHELFICGFVCPLPACILLKLWYVAIIFSLFIATQNNSLSVLLGYITRVSAGLLGLQGSLLVSSCLAWSLGALLVSISGGPCRSPLVSRCLCWSVVSHLVSRCYCWSPLIFSGLCWSPSVSNGLC